MRVTQRSRNLLRLQNTGFVLLFLALAALLAYISQRHSVEFDWTANQRNTLTAASEDLLRALDKPLSFSVYATEDENIRQPILDLVSRYQRVYEKTDVEFINPELEPALVRELGISEDGEVVIHYGERSEKTGVHSEEAYSNVIQRLARSEQRWLVFISGHGERDPLGQANHDLSEWGKQLQVKGIQVQPLNLTEQAAIPENTAAVVIASPQVDYLSGEVEILGRYLEQGGNLLWLMEPGPLQPLQVLADSLPLQLQPGMVVDPTTQMFAINDPRVAIVTEYPLHTITQNFNLLTLFPQARPLLPLASDEWHTHSLLRTLPRSWSETGEMAGEIELNPDQDLPGPLVIGVAMTRDLKANKDDATEDLRQQRVVVIGDGDFLSNTYLGNGGNMDLGMHIVNWLTRDDNLIDVPVTSATDKTLELSNAAQMIIALGFLLLLPLLLASSGFTIWWQRRKR